MPKNIDGDYALGPQIFAAAQAAIKEKQEAKAAKPAKKSCKKSK